MMACVLALVLLMDVSASMENAEYEAQRDGTAAGLESEEVGRLIERGGPVAVTAVEFADRAITVLPWRVVRDRAGAARFAAALRGVQRGSEAGQMTATGDAVVHALNLLDGPLPCEPDSRVIDLSTDGENTSGNILPQVARDDAISRGVRINGIGIRAPSRQESPAEWVRQNLMTPGGFVLDVEDWRDFELAIRRKLVVEIGEAVGFGGELAALD